VNEALRQQLMDLRPLLAKAASDIGRELAFSVTTGSDAHRSLRVLQSLFNGAIDATFVALRLDAEEAGGEAGECAGDEAGAAFDNCHWCVATPATECMVLQASEGDGRRVLRVDHLCASCASAYWDAIRKTAKRRSA